MELGPFIQGVFYLDHLLIDLDCARTLFMLIEHIVNKTIGDTCFTNTCMAYEDQFIVEVWTFFVVKV